MRFETVELGEVCLLGDGAHAKVNRMDSGIPYLTSKNLKQGFLDLSKVDYISKEDYQKLFSPSEKAIKDLKPGDVLVGIIGTFGNVYLYREEDYFGISSSIGIIRTIKDKILPEFLYFQVKSERFARTIEMYKGGSVQGYTNLPTLKKMPLYITTIDNQKRIINVFSSLEKKINLNKGIIKTLEDITQTIFKRWFIDFDYPNKEGEPYKSSGGKMIESDLGDIPDGWGIVELKEISSDLFAGGTPSRKKAEYWLNGNIPWLKTKEIKNNYIIKAEEFISKEGLVGSSAKWIPSNSILVAMYGATAGQLGYLSTEMTSNQACCAIVSETPNYIYSYLRMNHERLKDLATGSAQQNLSKDIISKFKVLCPRNNILKEYEEIVSRFSEQIIELTKENDNLERLRDVLLPKLLSGEIEISDESVID